MLNPDKLALIDYAFSRFQIRTFADLGGNWGVDGGYSLYALRRHAIDRACIVDFNFSEALISSQQKEPRLRLVRGDFREQAIAKEIGQLDAVLLFDVLLHQVRPNWDEVLALYADVRCVIIFNQQWVQQHTVRLFDLGEAEYFRNIAPVPPGDTAYEGLFRKLDEEYSPEKGRYRDLTYYWQWGITDSDLVARMNELRFELDYFRNCGQFDGLPNFENHAFCFVKSPGDRRQ
jgi:hypothetical protein